MIQDAIGARNAGSFDVGAACAGFIDASSIAGSMIKAGQANKTVTLSEGQEIEGWTLKSITRERLYFSSGEATYEMTRRKPSEMQQ